MAAVVLKDHISRSTTPRVRVANAICHVVGISSARGRSLVPKPPTSVSRRSGKHIRRSHVLCISLFACSRDAGPHANESLV